MSASNPLEQPLEPYPLQPDELEALKKDFAFVEQMIHELSEGHQFVLDRGWAWTLKSEGYRREHITTILTRSKALQRLLPYLWQGIHDDGYLIGERADLEHELCAADALMKNKYRFEHTYGEDWGQSRFTLELRSGIALISDITEATALSGEPFSHETSYIYFDELLEKHLETLLQKLHYKQYLAIAGLIRFFDEAVFSSPISLKMAISYKLVCSEQTLYWNSSRSGEGKMHLSLDKCAKFVNMLLHRNVRAMYEIDPQLVDVFCPKCGEVYCASEWQPANQTSDQLLCSCPKGHAQNDAQIK